MKIAFSPPDITEQEINEVTDTLRSGWITTGPKTKRFEEEIAGFCHTRESSLFKFLNRCPGIKSPDTRGRSRR